MYLLDTNLLLYAHFDIYPEHERAVAWVDTVFNGDERVGLPWQAILSFVRIGTDRRILPVPESVPGAWKQVEDWLACDIAWIPQPTERHAEILGELLQTTGMKSSLVSDAHLAALAFEHGLTICSADSDFARFRKVRWINPLEA
jgi:toxin-antitoxin system PIN domain toxin